MDTIIQKRQRLGKDIIATSSLTTLALLIVLNVCQVSRGNPVFVDNPSLAQFQSGRNIRHLPCIVRKSGMSGVCMFAIDCIKQNGTHLGTCIDRFYFGSCCQMKDESQIFAEEISDNSIDQNTISHFSHESTTQLSTNALFKAPTESLIESLGVRNHSTIHPYVQVSTITHMAPKTESTTMKFITTSKLPTASITMTTTTTTTTTQKPTSTTTSSPTTTTIKTPTRRRTTTTTAPILTIAPNSSVSENDFEPTTLPSKFTTFQVVETSTPNKQTEPTLIEEIQFTTTMRIPSHSQRPSTDSPRTKKPIITKIPAANFTTTQTTERPASRTTPKYKPTLVKRPTTTKKPFHSNKRPSSSTSSSTTPTTTTTPKTKYTRKPVVHVEVHNSTSSSPTRNDPPATTVKVTPLSPEPPTRAPRPKPKPTSEIFKITIPTAPTNQKAELTTTRTRPPTSTISSTTPTTVSTTTPISTTSETEKATQSPLVSSTTTESLTSSSTTSTKAEVPSPSSTSPTTSSTPPSKPSPTVENFPEPTSTYRPTLVTWTTVDDNKNNTHITIEETDWQPKPPPADWVPVPTIDPEVAANKNNTLSETSLDSGTTEGVKKPSSSTESNKIPELPSSTIGPVLDLAQNTSIPQATATEGVPMSSSSTVSSSTAKPTTTSTTQTASTSSTTQRPSETVTESLIPETSTDMPTEDFNATTSMPFTTTSAIPSLEGVDYRQVCGRRMFPEPRIVGGSNAAFGRWPWQISLRQWRTSTYLHKCGAALLNENWAITAAHCVDNVPPSDLLLRLGEYDLAEEEEPYGYQERRVQIVASHPQFDPRTFEYDLALLRFYEPVVFQPNIIPVCVPGSDEDFIGQTAFVTGWGRLYEDGPLPSVLQEVAVPIINNTICETMYRAAGYIEHIPHIFICAGWKKGGYDSCEGDSGGPMVLQREMDKRFILGGVISWGIGCAEPNQPGVYTRISEFRDWINQILQF
ncbi:serine proteinase stubble [Eupeodes corollae]|uniref:serine proteinase stubble n=1 Tax=Eupeodes corollae TaxID=290404 RepID=UPI002493892D|nr:serine proteinase stubble [Eupeodes corollae]